MNKATRENLMKRLDCLEPRTYYIEDLSETNILIYGLRGVEEVIAENGIEHIKNMLKNSNTPETVKQQTGRYFDSMSDIRR